MTQEIRNLVDDSLEAHVITAGLSDDSRFMQLKVIALDAIKRAKEAESKLAITVKSLEWYADKKNWNLGVNISMGSAFPLHEAIKSDKGKLAINTLSEIERLQK